MCVDWGMVIIDMCLLGYGHYWYALIEVQLLCWLEYDFLYMRWLKDSNIVVFTPSSSISYAIVRPEANFDVFEILFAGPNTPLSIFYTSPAWNMQKLLNHYKNATSFKQNKTTKSEPCKVARQGNKRAILMRQDE